MLVKNSRKESKKGDKLMPRWLGPYKIHEVLNKGTFKICNPSSGKVLMVAVNQCRLKVFIQVY